jgi:hypothetical protein
MTTATTMTPAASHSGAAGSAIFSGWDSRKFNYFTPKGRKASHYEDMTYNPTPSATCCKTGSSTSQMAHRPIPKSGQPLVPATGTSSAPWMKSGSAPTISASPP